MWIMWIQAAIIIVWEGWTSYQIFKNGGGGGLIGPQLLERVGEKGEGNFFQGKGIAFFT